jgi:tyrosyl-tRNA synthetase
VWLDAKRTSPYQMYQYWLQTADADAVRYLKLLTFLDERRILELAEEVAARPEKREAQRVLASEATATIHGADTVLAVEAASRILFQASDEVPGAETVTMLAGEMPVTHVSSAEITEGIGLVDLLVMTRLAESKGAARKLVEGGGVYLSNERQTQAQKKVSAEDVKWPGALLLRAGKKNYHLVLLGS